jgi:hypothetical protein
MPLEPEFIAAFTRTVCKSAEALLAISDADANVAREPGKWSRKEIVGHLIDSAANNHARFVRAQGTDHLLFEGYDQDAWVRAQRYNEWPWGDLVALWRQYNLHLANVMAVADPATADRPRVRHNLDQIAFVRISRDEPATLTYLMRDYVAHLEHHLRQALEPRQTW